MYIFVDALIVLPFKLVIIGAVLFIFRLRNSNTRNKMPGDSVKYQYAGALIGNFVCMNSV